MEDKPKKMTPKEQAWADAWLETRNKTEAARRAKYKGNASTLAHIGWENYRKAHIKEYLKQRLDEQALSAEEAVAAFSDIARGSIEDFLDFQEGMRIPVLDLRKAKELGKLHLIKKLEYTKEGGIKFELYPRDSALRDIGRVHGLFKDSVEHTGEVDLKVEFVNDWRSSNSE